MKRVEARLDSAQILDVVQQYTAALDLLDDYDHGRLATPASSSEVYRLSYEECRTLIDSMRFGAETFSDGNKRIAAAVFLYFLGKNGLLFREGAKVIADHTHVAMIVMIAESKPEEKETMVKLVMNFLAS